MSALRVLAHGKVNLSLEVIGKRRDGFHEVATVIQSIDLADEVLIEDSSDLIVECDRPELSGEANLAMRAARAMMERHVHGGGARIQILKKIPVAAGLGGGSADAAAVIAGLAVLHQMKLQDTDTQIIAASLGSDVPFFLTGGSAIAKGRGQLIYPLPDAPEGWLVMLVPPHDVESKTAALYRRLTPEMWTSGERTNALADAIATNRTIPPALLGNVFDEVAGAVFSSLDRFRDAMVAAGCDSVLLSGAGPALFSLFDSESRAREVAGRLQSRGFTPLVARTLTAREAVPTPETVS